MECFARGIQEIYAIMKVKELLLANFVMFVSFPQVRHHMGISLLVI